MPPILTVTNLVLELRAAAAGGRPVVPVDGVSFDIEQGECVALVGESGSGKSLTALTLLGLTRQLPGARLAGSALLHAAGAGDVSGAVDLVAARESRLQHIRGRDVSMVFQDPLSCLNPLLRVDYQIAEVLARHQRLKGRAAQARIIEVLEMVGVPQPAIRSRQFPHQLSGGLRQRVLMAIALAAEPRLLIADEPTTALDVTIQAQILATLRRLQREQNLSILFITHDLGVVAQLASRVMVMYAGRIVEQAPVAEFFTHPQHPYSQGLLSSLPSRRFSEAQLDAGGGRLPLTPIHGSPPRPGEFPTGCRFNPRCHLRVERCLAEYPPLIGTSERRAACWELDRARADWEARQSGAAAVAGGER